MKNRLRTNSLRTIKKYFPRFISLMIMSLLGVLVYVGLCSTAPDMVRTLDKFLDEYNIYDIKVVSSMGLNDNDLLVLSNINGIDKVLGIHSKDVLILKDDNEYVINVSSMPKDINELKVIRGRLPENSDEIVVEDNFLKKLDYDIDDVIVIDDEVFKNKEVKIVGSVNSSLYFNNSRLNQNRGVTNIGMGVINYYSYVMDDNFDMDYYTSIYVTVSEAKKEITSSSKYDNLVSNIKSKLNDIKSNQEQQRYDSIYKEINDEIKKNEDELNKELDKAKSKLDKAKNELNSAKKKLDSTKIQLNNAKSELDKAKKQINDGKVSLNNSKKQYGISDINSSLNSVNSSINSISNFLNTLDVNSVEYQNNYNSLVSLKEKQVLLNTLKEKEDSLKKAESTYNSNYSSYQSNYKLYQDGLNTYNDNMKLYNENKSKYLDSKKEAEDKINDAKKELEKIDKPCWYIYNRLDNQTYNSYIDQTKSIKSLTKLFPVVFYAVAILVSLISMNRMVLDDRGEIGTLKSLGFANYDIIKKYLTFSFTATLLGALLGSAIGLTFIPYVIFSIYSLLFDVPNFQFTLSLDSTLTGIMLAIVCICGASIITANQVLREKPSMLMRPKAPMNGKKILLEKVTWLWKRIKFSNKITIRNILRYKRRVSVTIFGICGCTALMLCGFGIKDSIVDITNMQYKETFRYDATIYTNELDIENVDSILDNDKIVSYTLSENISGTYNDSNINIIVTENNSLDKVVRLVDRSNEEIIVPSNDDVIITDKIADIYGIKVGDTINILDSDKREYSFKVTHIVKNYLNHYLYVSKDMIEKSNHEFKPNVIYVDTVELDDDGKDKLSQELLKNDEVINVVNMSLSINSTQDMLDSLDKVVVILVVLSACLSFVVLYNLANININERKREISTLKVLGFYDKEVDNYITKEMIILTILGISLGLGAGYLLTNMVISTVEMEFARFIRHIKLNSYIYSIVISALFTIIVNFVTHFTLKRIDMIESLKSVE